MEKEIKIKTKDKKVIVGTFRKTERVADKLVIFVHGFGGHKDEHIFFNGSKYFAERGFDTFRFNLYAGYVKGVRHFRETKISLHGEDITTVLKYFRKKYNKIYLIGHSYGGTSLLFTDSKLVDGLVFWDPSYVGPDDAKEGLHYNKKIDAYILDWGMEIIVGKKYIEELKNFPDCGELIQKIQKPVLFISAGKGNPKVGKKYFPLANNPKKFINIPKADHNFNNWESEKQLLEETFDWVNKN